jgi:hypothetical protein
LVSHALKAAGLDLERHPDSALLHQLIRDDEKLTDEEVGRALELIYSHMINRFKGELAEILSIGVWGDFAQEQGTQDQIGKHAHLLLGGDCRRAGVGGWSKGPDALIALLGDDLQRGSTPCERSPPLAPDDLVVAGVVEVKSYIPSYRAAVGQLRRHLDRLRLGFRHGGSVWSPGQLWFRSTDGRIAKTEGASDDLVERVPRILVLPRPRRRRRPSRFLAGVTRLDLPFGRERLMSAAYGMTEWFTTMLGMRVFATEGSPWPEMTPGEAGFNRIKEALYHIQLRDFRGLKEHGRNQRNWLRRRARLDAIAARLYNAYGWGLQESLKHRGMMWQKTDPETGEARITTIPTRSPDGPTAE